MAGADEKHARAVVRLLFELNDRLFYLVADLVDKTELAHGFGRLAVAFTRGTGALGAGLGIEHRL